MVDGNEFGLVVKLNNGEINWFFEKELSEFCLLYTSDAADE